MCYSMGCISMPVMPTIPKINIPVTKAPIDPYIQHTTPVVKPAPTVTTSTNVTTVPTTRPRFVYV